MAEIQVQAGLSFTVSGAGQYILGDASDDTVSTYNVQIVDGGSFSGSITPQCRTRVPRAQTGSIPLAPTGGGATLDDVAFVNVAYYDEGTGTYSTTAITVLPSLISIRASGMVCCLNFTSVAAGSAKVYVTRVYGASA